MKRVLLVALLLLTAGCGNVDWFPNNGGTAGGGGTGNATDPNDFNFTLLDNQPLSTLVSSTPVTLTARPGQSSTISWTVTISDGPNATQSSMAIGGVAITGNTGTILPNQTLVISHKTAASPATFATTNVNVGTLPTKTFQSRTQNQ